jgi:hypothetical protein
MDTTAEAPLLRVFRRPEEIQRWVEREKDRLEEEEWSSGKRRRLGYDAASFEAYHHEFKDFCSAELCDLAPPERPVLYLDHWSNDKRDVLRTTEILLERFDPSMLYCVNPDEEIVSWLREHYKVNAQRGYLLDALSSSSWQDVAFGAAFVDLCTGRAKDVMENLEAILHRPGEPLSLLAYTITGRDPDGESLTERVGSIYDNVLAHGFSFGRGGRRHSEFSFRSPTTTVFTGFYERHTPC